MKRNARRWCERLVVAAIGLAWIGCAKHCAVSCSGSGGCGDDDECGDESESLVASTMVLEFCLSAPNAKEAFPVAVTFTGTQSGAAPFTATAQAIVQPGAQRSCVRTTAAPAKIGAWSVTAGHVVGWTAPPGPLTCPGIDPGAVVFDLSSGQLACGTHPF